MASLFGGGAVDPETLYTKQACIGEKTPLAKLRGARADALQQEVAASERSTKGESHTRPHIQSLDR